MIARYRILTHAEVKKFIDTVDRTRRARIDRFYELFSLYGNALPSKYLKKIGTTVWELRPGDIRLFLTIKGNVGYVVHAIFKKTQKTPKRDLDLATKRIKKDIE